MNKAIYFDMDGTVAELYKVENWLPRLRAEDPSPYLEAEPKIDTAELSNILWELRKQGYTIGIISWLSMKASKEYDNAVRQAKRQWLKTHIPFVFDHIHLVKYGTPKHTIPYQRKGILVDDNQQVREQWERYGGIALDATPDDWLTQLRLLT